jgi:uncharacterized protein (TIGR03435 family)
MIAMWMIAASSKLLLNACICGVVVASTATGQSAPALQPAATLAYDVVSIKPDNGKGPYSGWSRTTPDGFSANLTVRSYVMGAFNLIMDSQLSSLPEWANTAQFEIQAKLDPERVKAHNALSREERGKQDSLMLQALLADRFHLQVRHELKQLPVYELVVAKGGAKLKESDANAQSGYSVGGGHLSGKGVEIQSLAYTLSSVAGRVIIDKTGFTGKYDIELNWASEDSPGATDTGPSIFAAVQEQLGLKLEPAKATLDTIVVEHIEKPSEN